jgi:UDP-N-acetylmuramyl pentapeptide phosphotransferase/UDP-N-acetylglucosamine-1-phosphate transferase
MFMVGVYDDFYNANFKMKFLLQIIVAKIIIDQGYVITNYHGLFGLYEVPWILAQFSTVFVFLVVVNAINFIDGIDGLALTQVIKTLLLIELLNVNHSPLTPLIYLLIASLIPLYFFNLKKVSKVFLGDSGSLFLGTLVSISLFNVLGSEYHFISNFQMNKTLFTVAVIIYPLIDLLRVFIIRIKDGKSPFIADQRHIHHILLNKLTKSHTSIFSIIIILELFILFILFNIFK